MHQKSRQATVGSRGARLVTLLVVIAPLGALLFFAAPSSGDAPSPVRPASARAVRVTTVETAPPTRQHRFHGEVEASERARLAFTHSGRLLARPVEVGQRVARGELLARIDARPFRHAVAARRAQLTATELRRGQGERDRRRVQHLIGTAAASTASHEQVGTAADALASARDADRAQLGRARWRLDETVLRAPFAGTVSAVYLEAGELASAGTPVLSLEGQGGREVHLDVPESVIVGLRVGDEAMVEWPLSELPPAAAHLERVGNASVGAARLFPVVVRLPEDGGALAGMTAEVLLSTRSAPVSLLPIEAIIDPSGERASVLALAGDRVVREPVEVLEVVGQRVAVVTALRPGAEVVVAGHGSLLDGDRVRVLR